MGNLSKFFFALANLFNQLGGNDDNPPPKKNGNDSNRQAAEEKKLADYKEKLSEKEAKIRYINEEFSDMIRRISDLEARKQKLVARYKQETSTSAKETYKAQIKGVQNELNGLSEERALLENNLRTEQLILQKLQVLYADMKTATDPVEIERLMIEFQEWLMRKEVTGELVNGPGGLVNTKFSGSNTDRDASGSQTEGGNSVVPTRNDTLEDPEFLKILAEAEKQPQKNDASPMDDLSDPEFQKILAESDQAGKSREDHEKEAIPNGF